MPPAPIWAMTSYGPTRLPGLRTKASGWDYRGSVESSECRGEISRSAVFLGIANGLSQVAYGGPPREEAPASGLKRLLGCSASEAPSLTHLPGVSHRAADTSRGNRRSSMPRQSCHQQHARC